jgi:tight adherence protein B
MLGGPLSAAVDAARSFIARVPPEVRIGLVTFADRPVVAQRLTGDREKVLAALDGVTAAGETALYDGVARATKLFEQDSQRNIILLSDGGDTASAGTLAEAVGAAAAAGASVFSIGWRTTETDTNALRVLARLTGGRHASAGSADLAEIYAGLAAELSNQYVISYVSEHRTGGEVSITVDSVWGTDTTVVLFPEVQAPAPRSDRSAPQPYKPPFLRDDWGLGVVVGLVFAAALSFLLTVFDVPLRRRRRRILSRRIGTGRADLQGDQGAADGRTGWIPEPIASAGEMVAHSAGFAERLDRRLEQAGLSLRPGEFVAGAFLASLLGGTVAGLLLQSILWALAGAAAAALIPIAMLTVAVRRRLRGLQGQVVDVLLIIASSLRAGHSFLQALDMVSKEIAEPAAGEFSRAVSEIRLGRSVHEALAALGDRMDSDDFRWAMMAVNIQREVGGNLAEVLDTVAETLRDRETVRRQVRVLAAEGKLSARILTVLPILITLYIAKMNAGFLDPLFQTFIGRVVLGAGAVLMLVGIVIMRKMVRIDV